MKSVGQSKLHILPKLSVNCKLANIVSDQINSLYEDNFWSEDSCQKMRERIVFSEQHEMGRSHESNDIKIRNEYFIGQLSSSPDQKRFLKEVDKWPLNVWKVISHDHREER